MPNKTIYVKDEDVQLFEEAEKLGGDSLSSVIAEALRRFVATKKAEQQGMKKVEEMKNKVRKNFKEDAYSELIGFLEVENTVEANYPKDYTTKGAVLVYYRAHTGEVVCELLADMIGFLEEEGQ